MGNRDWEIFAMYYLLFTSVFSWIMWEMFGIILNMYRVPTSVSVFLWIICEVCFLEKSNGKKIYANIWMSTGNYIGMYPCTCVTFFGMIVCCMHPSEIYYCVWNRWHMLAFSLIAMVEHMFFKTKILLFNMCIFWHFIIF